MAVLGFDLSPLRSAITELGQGVRQGLQQQQQQGGAGGDYLGYLSGIAQPAQRDAWDTLGRIAPPSGGPSFGGAPDFLGQLGAYAGQQGVLNSPSFNLLGALGQTGLAGGTSPLGGLRSVWDDLSAYANQLAVNAQQQATSSGQNTGPGSYPKPGPAPSTTPTSGAAGGATYAGLPADVAQWGGQVDATFGDAGAWVPAAMLAIIQHESSGDPNIQNRAGYPAYGLFQLWQQPGLTADQQFQAARTLAQQKLKSIQDAYAANGLNPDERTRARDLFLAWAGHFDYDTGQPNAGSRDVGSGQDYQSFLNEIMPMYDNIVRGRQQAPSAGASAGGNPVSTMLGSTPASIMQEFGTTDYSEAHPDTYAYGNAYGLVGSQHPGVDLGMPLGTKLYVPASGTVSVVGNDHGSGYFYSSPMTSGDPDHSGELAITLDNGDIVILGHMGSINLRVGDRVNAGDFAGLSGGSDGAHLHFEVRQRSNQTASGYQIVDPLKYFGWR